jgi:Ca-activated chloride channel family protein
MKATLFGITWSAIEHSVWFFLLFIIIGLLIYRFIRTRNTIQLLAGPWINRLFKNVSLPKTVIKAVLIFISSFFLVLALLRPQWNKKEEVIAQEGRDVFIALDISRSMLATDLQPDRLTYAKQKIKQLIQRLDAERVGLILFSGSAFVQCPLTADVSAFNLYLNQVDVETISSGSTAIDQALREALRAFNRIPERKNKLLVLFTDGEDFSSNLSSFKQEAQKENLRVFTIGVGTPEGAPIPLYDGSGKRIGHQQDEKGSIVITRLNEGILRTLAHDAGGVYMRVTQDDMDMRTLVHQVQMFEKEKLDDKTFSQLEEQYPYFLLVSFVTLVLEWLL